MLCYRHLVASVVYVKEILAKLGVYILKVPMFHMYPNMYICQDTWQ